MAYKNGKNGASKVVVIDDTTTGMYIYRHLFNKSNYKLHYFAKYSDAIQFIEEENPICVIVDFISPEHNTLSVIKDISQEHAVIVVSHYIEPNAIRKAMQAGAYDYLSKDNLTIDVLERSIRIAVRGRHVRDELEGIKHVLRTLKTNVKVDLVKITEDIRVVSNTLKKLDGKIDQQQLYFNNMNDAFMVELQNQMEQNRKLIAANACQNLGKESK